MPRLPQLACLLAALLGLRADAGADPPPPAMPGPSDGRARPDAVARNAACERCHADIAAEWRGSLHHHAATNPGFAAALRREPLPFCRGCHAPEADPERPAPRALARLGVGCVTCHGHADAVLAAPRRDLSIETAPHPLARDPRFAAVDACAGCHEFAFPGDTALMQSTAREHAASAHAATACAGCHMPATPGARPHRSHAFPGARDPDLLRRAVRVAATRAGAAVHLSLAPGAVGHAFPTGDLFRRLVVVAEVPGEAGPRATASRVLTRHFTPSRRETADDRVGAPALAGADVEVHLDLGPAADGREILWRVVYERVAFPRAASERAEVEASTVVASGALAP